jgi:hypothetical protein
MRCHLVACGTASQTQSATQSATQSFSAAAAAQGALRGIEARKIGADELIRSGFFVNIHIICGGYPLQFLNPQPLPPVEGPAGR